MKKTAWMAIASLALAIGLSACKSNGAAPTAPSASSARTASVPAPVTATWRPTDKTSQFLSAFRPEE